MKPKNAYLKRDERLSMAHGVDADTRLKKSDRWLYGHQLKVGMKISMWWKPEGATILKLTAYTGEFVSTFIYAAELEYLNRRLPVSIARDDLYEVMG